MADYYPLLSRAVGNLPETSVEARQAIYARARDALERQLRGVSPKLNDADIVAELLGLEDVIKRIEAEAGAGPEAPHVEPGDHQPIEPPALARDPMPSDGSLREPGMQPKPPTDLAIAELERSQTAGAEQAAQRIRMPDGTAQETRHRRRLGLIAVLGTVAILVMGLFALSNRTGTERYTRADPQAPPQISANEADSSKREVRLDGAQGETPVRDAAPAETKRPEASRSDPIPARPVTEKPAEPATPPPPAPEQNSQVVLPVVSRAFMILETPGRTPSQYEGQAHWSFAIDPGAKPAGDKPAEKALRARIEIAEAGLVLDFTVARANDASLQASHIVTLAFETKEGVPPVREMTAVEWRERESQAGTTFAGTLVPIQDNFFMIGLDNSVAGQARNMDLLRNQRWMVFEIRQSNGRRGAFLIEKGSSGEKAISEALAAWK